MQRITRILAGGIAVAAIVASTAAFRDSAERRAESTAAADAALARALDDPTIVAIFDYANTVDIETGKLGSERGASKDVREFGAMIARDHAQVRQLGRDLAAKLKVTPTPPADGQARLDHEKAMKRLRALSGAEFDKAFARHEANFHAAVIDAINTTLLPAIQNAELRDLVVKVGPAFEAHRLAAEKLAEKVGAPRA